MTAKIENHRCASLRLARRSLATPVSKNRFLLRSASLPPQHAQHRRALGTPELRAGLRRKEGYLLSLPSIYEPVCAQKPRPHWLDMLGYYLSPLPGLVPRQSKGLTRTFNYTLEGRLSEAAISGVRMQ